ncbi:MAG: CRISPR-associated helicase Cas3' [Candidatus Goldbacteria bacterium]|nr:CRISPR-associated helicase Cas3' [Candidatus Goldiibacteriota bacterium]
MEYYAHSVQGQSKEKWQLLKDHLTAVADMSRTFAQKFGAGELGYMAGILHDVGKYSAEFQGKLDGKNQRVDHSTAGAKEVMARYGELIGKILAYPIAGHHAGLADFIGAGDDACLEARLKNVNISVYNAFEIELKELLQNKPGLPTLKADKHEKEFSCFMLVRMLYSCLVDADYMDTERFCDVEKSLKREKGLSISELESKLSIYLKKITSKAEKSDLNAERSKIMKACIEKASSKPGFFTLTVPTGGGKTFSSLAFGLKHAKVNNLERVIYVIPYTSIIEQNADVFKKALGAESVLEHHSNYDYKEGTDDEDESDYKMKLAAENWDMPLIATTNVQFFESLFSNRGSRCRKLHNIANSVIILDEAQMLPVQYMKPCIYALAELIKNYGCSVVFCTATQPAIFDDPPEGFKLPGGMEPVEIIDKPKPLYEKLKAVNVEWAGEIETENLINKLADYERVLCIVNTRKFARELYDGIKGKEKDGIYHLSAGMCPAHRTDKISEIKGKLKNGERCRVISTQLIEAGVDIDFPVVYREIAGIDSIAQAAGRCNRERKIKEGGKVYVFKPAGHKAPPGFLARTAGVAKEVINQNESKDLLSLKNIKEYFEILYSREGEGLDGKNILKSINNSGGRLEYPFRTISDSFNLIDNKAYSLVVKYDEKCEEILEKAKFSPYLGSFARKLQRYTVQVYKQDYDKLVKAGMVKNFRDMFFVLEKKAYVPDTGVSVEGSNGKVPKNYII